MCQVGRKASVVKLRRERICCVAGKMRLHGISICSADLVGEVILRLKCVLPRLAAVVEVRVQAGILKNGILGERYTRHFHG